MKTWGSALQIADIYAVNRLTLIAEMELIDVFLKHVVANNKTYDTSYKYTDIGRRNRFY